MSRFNLAKKLLPAKKAWKGFKTTIKSKLQKLKISKTTKNFSIYTFKIHIRIAIPCRLYSPSPIRRDFHYNRHENTHIMKGFRAIYIDELYQRNQIQPDLHRSTRHKGHDDLTSKAPKEMVASSSRVKEARDHDINPFGKQEEIAGKGIARYDVKQFRGVDERAEEFISKFREEMKLEREKSIYDFHEMLKRSV